ncbi:hypothetical protein DM01DRAFT_27151 [Hesseltinella vesiculosa]|uniref:Uncharacterized protein n=1 Tax=Hesseltinella vesiculosa TaxID=101127 RepID=A0A1X2GHY5_9FUNG|nr:hypothetical protein DM01DRAFT_27151 [Hesseltinella vesiculosa]
MTNTPSMKRGPAFENKKREGPSPFLFFFVLSQSVFMADESTFKKPKHKPHLPTIITTLDELREEDEETIVESKLVKSPLSISRSELSLTSLVRSSSQHAHPSPSLLSSPESSSNASSPTKTIAMSATKSKKTAS